MEKWGSTEIETLNRLYEENNVPSDQLVKDKNTLGRFVGDLNQHAGKNYTDQEAADQLFKLRKSGKLPRIRK
jgi:hypothetical protein